MIDFKLWTKTSLITALFYSSLHESEACTRVLWTENGQLVIVGRTMDWGDSTHPDLWVFPRGLARDGNAGPDSVLWRSKYGSLAASAYGEVTVDGLNERGLSGHVLYFKEADFGVPETGKKVLASGVWLQFILDNYGSVAEAVKDAQSWSVVMNRVNGHDVKIHIALEDESGDSAIFELVNKKLVIHHHKKYKVLANSPDYQTQLALCHQQQAGVLSVAMKSAERFCLSSLFLEKLPKASSADQGVAAMLSLVRTLSVPFSATNRTFYRTVIDLTHKQYYFDNAIGLNLFRVELGAFDFSQGAKVRHLQPMNSQLVGDVSQQFVEREKPPY